MVRKFNWNSIEESNGGGDFTPLPAGPYVSDDDVNYIARTIKNNIIG